MESKIRVRFAPSPTGPLHIGGVRTALYNYLFAKQNGGDFILRIEDTDQTRYVEGAEKYIIESLEWLGLNFDEGVHIGGDFAPYRQSERKDLYRKYVDMLLDNGNAYIAFDTPEDLDKLRKEYESKKEFFQYDLHNRKSLRNSLNMDKTEVDNLISSGTPYVVRFKMPKNVEVKLNDLIRGDVSVNTNTLDDKVLFKSDGMPTYHMANVVDDYLMKITHVIRGEEWLPSAPLHVLLYQALGWKDIMPKFAHLPLLLKPDGNGKLSKRDGDRLGFPVFPLEWIDPKTKEISSGYRESGYFPDAVVNILALLGWNPGTEQEIFTMEELVEQFDFDRINKAGAKFDLNKARWFNHQYLIEKSDEELAEYVLPIMKEKINSITKEEIIRPISLVKERCNFPSDFENQLSFFFIAPETYDEGIIKKRWKDETPEQLNEIVSILKSTLPFDKQIAHQVVSNHIKEKSWNMGAVMNCLRLSIVGEAKGPDLFEIIDIIGVEESINRIEKAIKTIVK